MQTIIIRPDRRSVAIFCLVISLVDFIAIAAVPILVYAFPVLRTGPYWQHRMTAGLESAIEEGLRFGFAGRLPLCVLSVAMTLTSFVRWRRRRWEADGSGVRMFYNGKLVGSVRWSEIISINVALLGAKLSIRSEPGTKSKFRETIAWTRYADVLCLKALGGPKVS